MRIADAGGERPARRPDAREARGDEGADRGRRRRSPTSTRATSPTWTTSTGWRTRCCEQHGHVDILVNNAGRSIRRSIALSYDRPHDFERTMQLNYFGAVHLVLKFLPVMRQRKSGQIVNVSSIGVQTNMPRFSAYVASKSALDAFSRCIASEIVDDGVKHHDDPHAARPHADDRADEDVRPLPDDHARRGGGDDHRRDHLQAEADRDADGDARPGPLRAQPEVDRLHPQHRVPPVPRLGGGEGRQGQAEEGGRARADDRATRRRTSRSRSRT